MDVEKLAAELASAMSAAAERINFAMAELRKAGLVAPSNTGTSGYGATGYNGRDPETGRPLCEHNADAETCETEHHYPRFKDYRISRSAHNAHYGAPDQADWWCRTHGRSYGECAGNITDDSLCAAAPRNPDSVVCPGVPHRGHTRSGEPCPQENPVERTLREPREIKCPTCGVTGGMPHDCETAGRIS